MRGGNPSRDQQRKIKTELGIAAQLRRQNELANASAAMRHRLPANVQASLSPRPNVRALSPRLISTAAGGNAGTGPHSARGNNSPRVGRASIGTGYLASLENRNRLMGTAGTGNGSPVTGGMTFSRSSPLLRSQNAGAAVGAAARSVNGGTGGIGLMTHSRSASNVTNRVPWGGNRSALTRTQLAAGAAAGPAGANASKPSPRGAGTAKSGGALSMTGGGRSAAQHQRKASGHSGTMPRPLPAAGDSAFSRQSGVKPRSASNAQQAADDASANLASSQPLSLPPARPQAPARRRSFDGHGTPAVARELQYDGDDQSAISGALSPRSPAADAESEALSGEAHYGNREDGDAVPVDALENAFEWVRPDHRSEMQQYPMSNHAFDLTTAMSPFTGADAASMGKAIP